MSCGVSFKWEVEIIGDVGGVERLRETFWLFGSGEKGLVMVGFKLFSTTTALSGNAAEWNS